MLRVHELDKEMSGEDRFHLENISFHLPKGYICGLVGENGAGKTTLLRCLMGLYRSTGDIVIDGHNLNSDEAAAREVIAVVGDEGFFDENINLEKLGKYYGQMYVRFDMEKYLAAQSCADFIVSSPDYFRSNIGAEEYLSEELVAELNSQTEASLAGFGYRNSRASAAWMSKSAWLMDNSHYYGVEQAEQMFANQDHRDDTALQVITIEGLDDALLDKLILLDGDLAPLHSEDGHCIAISAVLDDYGNLEHPEYYPAIGDTLTLVYGNNMPYVDSRSGELIDINKRIGILDRKLRVVTENAKDRTEWLNWIYRAFQSVYGYEFQGDSLLLARINLLNTFCDYLKAVWKKNATKQQLTKIADIVSWNIWQMDGLTGTVPFGNKPVEFEQFNLFAVSTESENSRDVECKIKDWISNQVITFSSIKRG